MADLSSTIDIIFRGINQTSDAVGSVAQDFGKLNDSVHNIAEPFADLAGKVAVVQTALLALSGVIGTLAYKEAAEFQNSLLDLQKQMEANEGTANAYSGQLEELAVKYGVNANALVTSAADFKAAGYDIDTSIQLVKQSLDLMIAGGVAADASVQVLNRSLAGFQIPAADVAREAAHIGDVLNKTADLTKSSFSELATGFADLSPIARLTGLTMEEVAAILSKVIDTFGSGAEAANGLKTGLLRLVDPPKEAAQAMQDLGVKFDAAGKPIGTVKQILETIAPAFANLTDSQKLSTASMLFGTEQAARMVEALGKYGSAMQLAGQLSREAGGSIEKEVTIKLGAATAQVNSTNEAWRQFLRVLGDKILLDTTGVISSLGDMALSFKKVVEGGGLDPLFDLLTPQLKHLAEIIREAAKNLPDAFAAVDFSGLVKALNNLGVEGKKALEALFGPIDLTTMDGLKAAIQNVVDVLTGLTNLTAGELGGLAPFLAGIRQMVLAFKDGGEETQNFTGKLLGWGAGISAASGALAPLNTALLAFVAFGGKLAPIGAEMGLLATAMTGPQGLAVALGAATAALTVWLVGADKLADYAWPDWLAGYQGATPGTAAADIAEGFASLTARIEQFLGIAQKATPAVDGLNAAVNKPVPASQWDGAISSIARFEAAMQKNQDDYDHYFDNFKEPLPALQTDGVLSRLDEIATKGRDTQKELAIALSGGKGDGRGYDIKVNFDTGQAIPELSSQMGALGIAVDGTNTKLIETGEKIKVVKIVAEDGTVTYRNLEQQFGKTGEKAKKLGDDVLKTAKDFNEAAKNANDFAAKMEGIASNERIKNIEAVVSIKTAQLNADVKRVEAAFKSIDNTITSTGDLLGSLFGNLSGADFHARSMIENQIALENKRRQDALDLQKKLAEAEIERIQAQTAALNRGDSLIKIDGAGLKPELEAFMWKILSLIRVRANAEFSNYLLGVGAA